MAGQELIHITQDEREWARLNSELKYILDNKSLLIQAKREGLKEGREEGLTEGRVEGREKGLIEGREEGLSEGRKEGRIEIARKLLATGAAPEFVEQITGLDRETIEKL